MLTLYDSGEGVFKAPFSLPSEISFSRIECCSYIIVHWGLFPQNLFYIAGELLLIGVQSLAVRGSLNLKLT